MAETSARPPLSVPRVAAALAAILMLAVVLPYAAVRRMHQGRVDAADREAVEIGRALRDVLTASPSAVPPDVELVEGAGTRPVVLDERWTALKTLPLARALRDRPPAPGPPASDPWGNAFMILVRPAAPRGLWVLSAGPDGTVQTLLSAAEPVAAGDDRLLRVP